MVKNVDSNKYSNIDGRSIGIALGNINGDEIIFEEMLTGPVIQIRNNLEISIN